MRKIKKVVSVTVVTAMMAAGVDMGSVMAADTNIPIPTAVEEDETILSPIPTMIEGDETIAIPTATPTATPTPTVIEEDLRVPTPTLTPTPTPIPIEDCFDIENGVLKKYTGLGGEVVIPDEVTAIGSAAFEECWNLTSVVIPDGVTTIGSAAFRNCGNLTSVVIPDGVTSIGSAAFENCISLTGIIIPDEVTAISPTTFRNCEKLTSVVIPDGVTSIGSATFENCSSLTDVVIPDGVTLISDNTFSGCSSLSSIELPSSLTSIGTYAFSYCTGLNQIELPDNLMTIGTYAFSYCSSLNAIKIPNDMKKVKSYTFYNCTSLSSIEIPDSVLWISSHAFSDCSNLKILCVQGSYAEKFAKEMSVAYEYTEEKEFEIVEGVLVDYYGNGSDIVVPEGVTKIGYGAFANCTNIISVKLPEGVSSIGKSAFSGCTNLNTVELPKGLKSIRSYAFSGCSNLNSINIPEGVTNIGCYAFNNCSSLTTIKLPEGVTRIGWNAFTNCSNLSEAELPESLSVIGKNVFYNCNKLSDVEIPEKTVDAEIHQVYTEADLQQIMNYPNDTFELMNDIALNESWDTVEEFSGVLDGNGYTISNVDTTLFYKLSKASIVKDLNISGNINITKNGASSTFLASSINGTVENCVTKGSIEQTRGTGCSIAGFAATNNGIIRGCKNEANIIQTVNGRSFGCVAGIVEVNYGTLDNCENTGNIESASMFTGGFAGGYYISYTRRNGQIINCTNKGNIHSNFENQDGYSQYKALVGGIIAQNESFVYGCTNEGSISADSERETVGGIAGESNGYSYFIRCKNTGKVEGGICGHACIISGGFDENDKFCVSPGNIIIAECENNISGVENDKKYYICQNAESGNGEIRISRCKNIVNGEIRDTYCGNVASNGAGGSTTEENGNENFSVPTAPAGSNNNIVIENNGETEWKEVINSEEIIVNLGEKKDIGLLSEEGISGIFIDNPFIGWMENDGIYTPQMEGNGTAYYVYTDGSIALHDFIVKSDKVVITPSPTPEITITVPEISPTEEAKVTAAPTITKKPTAAPTITKTPTAAPKVTKAPTPTSAQAKKKSQSIKAKNITKAYGSKAFNIGAKTTGNGKLTYKSNNKKVVTVSSKGKVTIKGYGKATITIKASATKEYKAAQKKITITIKPKKQKISSVQERFKVTIKWKKDTNASGYIIQYSMEEDFGDAKKIVISNNKTTSKQLKNIMAFETYYVRVCSYKKVSGKKILGDYSSVETVMLINE